MSETIGSINWVLRLDDKGFRSGLKKAGKDVDVFSDKTKKFAKDNFGMITSMAAAGAAVIAFGKNSVRAYEQAASAHKKLETNLLNVKGNTLAGVKSLEKLADHLQKVGIVENDAVIEGQSMLATFKLQAASIAKLTPKIADMVVQIKGHNATGEDFANVNKAIGKAVTGNAAILGRYGVVLTAAQKEIIKTGNEQQRVAAITQALSQNYGNLNKALADTPQGRITQLKNAFNDLQEKIGESLVRTALPIMKQLSKHGEEVASAFGAISSAILHVGGMGVTAFLPLLALLKPIAFVAEKVSELLNLIPGPLIQIAALAWVGTAAVSAFGGGFFTLGESIQYAALAAQEFGGSMLSAMGGPVGLGIAAIAVGAGLLFKHLTDSKNKANELDKEIVKIGKSLMETAHKGGRSKGLLDVLAQIKDAGGEGAKAVEKLNRIGMSNKDIIKSISTETEATKNLTKAKKELEISRNLKTGAETSMDPGSDYAKKMKARYDKAKQAYDGLKTLSVEFKETTRKALKDEIAAADAVGDTGLANHFRRIAKHLSRDGDVGKAYSEYVKYSGEVQQKQKDQEQSAIRLITGLSGVTKSTELSTEAMSAGSKEVQKLYESMDKAAGAATRLDAKTALSITSQTHLREGARQYFELMKTNADDAHKYAVMFTDQLGIDPLEADKVIESFAQLGANIDVQWKRMAASWVENLIPLDEAFADKLEIKPGGPSAQQLLQNVTTISEMNRKFFGDVQYLYSMGFTDVADNLGKQGVKTAGIAAQQLAAAVKAGNTTTAQKLQDQMKTFNDDVIKNTDTYSNQLKTQMAGKQVTIPLNLLLDPKATSSDMNIRVEAKRIVKGAFASGGFMPAGGPYLVGEEGPELIVPSMSGQVMTASQTAQLLNQPRHSGGNAIHYHLHPEGLIVTNRKQARDASLLLMEEFNKAAKANGWTQVADGKPVAP